MTTTPAEMRGPARAGSHASKLSDMALVATLVGVVVILAVSFINQRELRRLSARVTQLETLTTAAGTQGGNLNKVYDVDVSTGPAKGPEAAAITVAEFSDFECPFCLAVNPTIKQLEDKYNGKVRVVWKHLPLVGVHARAMDAAIAAEAAKNQGKFWEFHDKLFANQQRLEPDDLKLYAQQLGLDLTRFDHDRENPEMKARVEADMAQAAALGVKSTPTFFINGRLVRGAMPFETFTTIVDAELAKQSSRQASSN